MAEENEWKSIALKLTGLVIEYEKFVSETPLNSAETQWRHSLLQKCMKTLCIAHPQLAKFVDFGE